MGPNRMGKCRVGQNGRNSSEQIDDVYMKYTIVRHNQGEFNKGRGRKVQMKFYQGLKIPKVKSALPERLVGVTCTLKVATLYARYESYT